MYYFFYCAIISICIINITCSNFENKYFNHKVQQVNYLSLKNIYKIKPGMKKEQVLYILGNPIIKNPFNPKIWYYIFYDKKKLLRKTLILIFNENNILTIIN